MRADEHSPSARILAEPYTTGEERRRSAISASPVGILGPRLEAVLLDDTDSLDLEEVDSLEYAMDRVEESGPTLSMEHPTILINLCLMCDCSCNTWDPLPCCMRPVCVECSAKVLIRTRTLDVQPHREPLLRSPYPSCGNIFEHATMAVD